MAKARFRLQYMFWLDVNKPEQHDLAEMIDDLKQRKAFSGAVRDGLRLMVDLWHGNLDVLLALFPWIEEALYERFAAQQPAPDSALQAQLARLEMLLLEQGHTAITAVGAPTGGPKAMTVPEVPGSDSDDNDAGALVITKAAANDQSAHNFLASAFGLQQ